MGSATRDVEVHDRSPDLAPGTIIGDYRIDHTIGVGGMAAVYQATQPVIGKRVAIKVLHRTKSDTALNRFIKEARAVNLIGHPNIVDVFGFGMTDSGRAYLVMELLVGETLAVRIKRDPISLAETCDVLVEVAHALEAAHEAGIIHRDLKPENVFLARRKHVESVKLLDFGIAKLIGDSESGMVEDTRPGVLIGTPRYISPEQVRGLPLDGGADIYALGVVAYELLAGRAPFSGGSYDLFEKHAKLRPPKPSAFNPQLPEQADALVGAMLAKEPSERPTLTAIRAALVQLRTAPASALAAARTAAAAEPTDVHAIGVTQDATRPIAARSSSAAQRWGVRVGLGAAAVGIALAIAATGGRLPTRAAAVPPIAPPAALAEPVAVHASDEPAIELDPVEPARAPHKRGKVLPAEKPVPEKSAAERSPSEKPAPRPAAERSPSEKSTPKAAAERSPSEKPARAAVEKPAVEKPAAEPAAPDDDAVRSPFERAP